MSHGLCYCAECTAMARRLANAIAADEVHRLTEPEVRRAAGEWAFCTCSTCVRESCTDLRWLARRAYPYMGTEEQVRLTALLRAIVQQALVDRFVAWIEEEVFS